MSESAPRISIDVLLAEADFVRGLARRLLDDESRADDVAQETWVAALRRPPRGAVRPWLRRVVRNLAARVRRDEGARARRERAAVRSPDSVRTGSGGEFRLAMGDRREVTAWHPDLSPVTAPLEAASHLVLPPRATIRGRLLDETGQPRPGVEVILERTRKAETDADGRFAFEGVEAGAAGLVVGGQRFVVVRLRPGETADEEIGAGIPRVRIALRSGDRPFAIPGDPKQGVLVGLDRVGGLLPYRPRAGDESIEVEGALPGRYVLIATDGQTGVVEIRGPEATLDLGTVRLTVHGPPGTPLQVVPEEAADDLVLLLAGRAVFRRVDDTGTAVFAPIAPGRYVVAIDRTTGHDTRLRDARVAVGAEGSEVTIGE